MTRYTALGVSSRAWHDGRMNFFGITWHSLSFALGFVLAWQGAEWVAKKLQAPFERILPLFGLAFIASLLGARALFVVMYPETWSTVFEALSFWQGGLVSYGGLVVGAAVILGGIAREKKDYRPALLQAALTGLLAAWGLGRIGNYLTGDVIGVVPVALLETAVCWVLAAYLIWQAWRERALTYWQIWAVAGCWFLGRVVIDLYRTYDTTVPATTAAGVVALLCFSSSFYLWISRKKS